MRTESEMMELLINTAKQDERILAAYMNGSRTNPNARRDIFCDYDVVYVVKDTAPFIEDREWSRRFGEILYMQYPDENVYFPAEKKDHYGWLMQLRDGNRVDITVSRLSFARKNILTDRLCRVLFDRDSYLPSMGESTDEDHWVKRPGQAEFDCTCNEYWWCMNNVSKGLFRKEASYTLDMINLYIRPMLYQMLTFLAGADHDFEISVGKSGKYITRYLDESIWNRYLNTFSSADISEIYEKTQVMNDLFEEVTKLVAEKMNFHINKQEAKASREFLEHVYGLPEDAKEVY